MNHNHLKSNLAKPFLYLFIAIGVLCFLIEPAHAHGVSVFAWVEGDTVFVESKFSGGKRVNAGKIIVTDPQGTELLAGTTNEKGEFSFKVPKKTELKIVLLAGTGHRGEWTIAAGEIEMPAAAKKPVPEKSATLKGIIIGIGCIFSLTGIAAYIRSRKKKKLDHESTKI
jgi:nickel transport protein